jgi:hypothetical protein
MSKNFYLLLLTVLTGLSSCTYRLGAGLHTADVTYLTRPTYRGDSVGRSASYASAVLSTGFGMDYLLSSSRNTNTSGLVNWHRAHTWRRGSLAYGAFGYVGQYKIGNGTSDRRDSLGRRLTPEAGRYGYQGLGLRASYSVNVPLGETVDWRVAGVEAALSREFGALTRLRERLPEGVPIVPAPQKNFVDWTVVRDRYLLTAGLTTEINLKSRSSDASFNVRYFAGRSAGGYERLYDGMWFPVRNMTFAFQGPKTTASLLVTQLYTRTTYQFGYSRRLGRVNKNGGTP